MVDELSLQTKRADGSDTALSEIIVRLNRSDWLFKVGQEDPDQMKQYQAEFKDLVDCIRGIANRQLFNSGEILYHIKVLKNKARPKCKCGNTEFKHIHDCAHGIEGTHMSGSERFVCTSCDYSYYKEAGENIGLKFVLD